jgi:hypothetical protein
MIDLKSFESFLPRVDAFARAETAEAEDPYRA